MTDHSKDAEEKTVLVAHSESHEREFVSLLLKEAAGFKVASAQTSAEMIKQLASGPDFILLDLSLGPECFRAVELMRRMPKLNHVAIAGLGAEQSDIERCMSKGFNGFFQKPFTPQGLLARVWKILDSTPPLPPDGGPATLEVNVAEIDDLPTLPTVYAQVEELCQDPDVDADELAKVIQTDPSITLKLLKLSNSAFFGFSREIKSVRDAVSLLGNEAVKNAVLSISVFEAGKDLTESAGMDRAEFWRHSAACGSIVRFLARKLRIPRDDAFTSGILHDMGKIILDGLYSSFYAGVLARVETERISVLEAEESGLGLSHASLGKELAQSWGIPPRLVEAITYHHRPGRAELDPELASLVHIGDAVSRNLGIGSGGDPFVPVIHSFAFTQLAVDPSDLGKWEEEMMRDIEKDMVFLSAIA